ncbi:MAG: Holliday junction resolvase RuvX [Rhodobacteraceae bacterium]|nr:Holliday junction resolvase RuvX [Paracoccaceae bacterium]
MIFEDAADFLAALPTGRALMGLDLGTKTIGVSVSDSRLSVASPLQTVKRKKFGVDADALQSLIERRQRTTRRP